MNPTTEEKGRGTMNGKPVFNVAAKSIINKKSGFAKKLLCDGMTFSLGDACVYRCAFCYVPSMFDKLKRVHDLKKEHGLTHDEMVVRRLNALSILEGELLHKGGKRKYPDSSDTRVIYSSPSVDVAGNMDLVRETVEACKLILQHTHWQIRLLSKSNLLHKVAELLMEWSQNEEQGRAVVERMIFGVSTGTLDDGIARAFEQDTPLVSSRIKSLHWLQDHGFRTFGMICPSLPQIDAAAYALFARDASRAIRAEKCEHVWAEVINVRGESMARTVKALHDAGHRLAAALLAEVSNNADSWEHYNRETFRWHAFNYNAWPGKLRYLTYVTERSRDFWDKTAGMGAVLL
jgi:DNA repair photolyase